MVGKRKCARKRSSFPGAAANVVHDILAVYRLILKKVAFIVDSATAT
jgi:hypothetical protein